MSPEVSVRSALVDPVGIHPVEQVVPLECLDECRDGWALVWWNYSPVWQCIGRIGRGCRVILTAKIAVLGVAAVAEIGP